MKKRFTISTYVLMALIGIGLIYSLWKNPIWFLLPLLVFGIIFLLYKFPPNRYQMKQSERAKYKSALRKQKERHKKMAAFKVIQGSRSDQDSEEPPPYH